MAGNVKEVTDSNFDEVLEDDKPVLIDFWAAWCGPCRMIAPILEEIAGEYSDKITIGKMNVDENPKIPQQFGILSIPTLMVFVGGEVKKTMVGAMPKDKLVAELKDWLK